MSNPCAKTRKVEQPYEVWKNDAGWEWRVLKKYQSEKNELTNHNARWMCAVKSPYTHGGYDYGDVFVREIKASAKLVEVEGESYSPQKAEGWVTAEDL